MKTSSMASGQDLGRQTRHTRSETVLTLGVYLFVADSLTPVSLGEASWPEGQLEWVYLGTWAVPAGAQKEGTERYGGAPNLRTLQRRARFEVFSFFLNSFTRVRVVCMCVCVCAPRLCLVSVELRRGHHWIPWDCRYRGF